MKPEIIRDRTLDWLERLMNSPWLERGCWCVIVAAALFFGPVAVRILIK